MFTTAHFIWIGICVALIGSLSFVSLRFKFSFRTSAFIMAAFAIVSEISKISSHMRYVDSKDHSQGMVLGAEFLPLHLCSILIFAFIYLPFAKNERLKEFILSITVPVGLIGSALAILMATSGTNFKSVNPYQCFLYHSAMTWFSIYLIATKQVELGFKAWKRNLFTLLGLVISMIWVNSALQEYDTNFWYVVRPPVEGLPLLNLDHGWFVYFGMLLLFGFLGLSAVHLPFMVKEAREAKKRLY